MSYASLYNDSWATDPLALEEETHLFAEIIHAHLLCFYSTPASAMSWNTDAPHRLQRFFINIAHNYPRMAPSAAIRAMLVVLRYKSQGRKHIIAFNDDAETLFYIAFMQIALAFRPSFTLEDMVALMETSAAVVNEFLVHRDEMNIVVEAELEKDARNLATAKTFVLYEFFLGPFVPPSVRRDLGLGGAQIACITMPTSTPLKPIVPPKDEQEMVFPPLQYKLRERMDAIVEEDEEDELVSEDTEAFDAFSSLSPSTCTLVDVSLDDDCSVSSSCASLSTLHSFHGSDSFSTIATYNLALPSPNESKPKHERDVAEVAFDSSAVDLVKTPTPASYASFRLSTPSGSLHSPDPEKTPTTRSTGSRAPLTFKGRPTLSLSKASASAVEVGVDSSLPAPPPSHALPAAGARRRRLTMREMLAALLS
ncbi:hypothetical protein D9611_014744 [Ephemerocybe angulata]|uniref:Uncharacterized protein n=1 Tax=Ephemerocybe angulata TaxID=980116 RepID=A0A8H5B7K6_9AGAR|nr:hypothetical protein D9611_014744 [Tulosesus angulatus]